MKTLAQLADRLLTTLTGLAVALIALFPLRTAGASEELWIGLVMIGLGLAVAGPSAIGKKTDTPDDATDQRGSISGELAWIWLAAALACAALTSALVACAPNRIVVRHALDFARRPGPCFVRLTIDGREITAESDDPAITCDPPPEFCAPSPASSP